MPGGKVVLHEYHPINKKFAVTQDGEQFTLVGDYFSDTIEERPAPYRFALEEEREEAFPLSRYRYWQIGEVVTAFSGQNMIVETLTENPGGEPIPLPATFTLVARKRMGTV